MSEIKHTVLCVDDEMNILNSLKRLFRREDFRLLTAKDGDEGLKILKENDVHLVITDQRMPEMSGTEFLARVKEKYPDVIRIVLTGYTDVDSITESINRGHIYKFILKPWNDQNLKLEIRQALEQYDLIKANQGLHKKILEQNEELKRMNESLEARVRERTRDLEIQSQALELSRAILEDLPTPLIGVSKEGTIVLMNREVQMISSNGKNIELGKTVSEYFSIDLGRKISAAFDENRIQRFEGSRSSGISYHIDIIPLSGAFRGRGVILILSPMMNHLFHLRLPSKQVRKGVGH